MDIRISESRIFNSICAVQFRTAEQDTFLYKSSSHAIKNNMIEVKEVDEAGSVNDLLVINYSDYYVFFMDGDILKGSKQNRVLNTSVLLRPNSKTVLPVSCVEAGRWRYSTSKFDMEDNYVAPSSMRSAKSKQVNESLKKERFFKAKQNDIWSKVENLRMFHKVNSKTSNLSDIYYEKEENLNSAIRDFQVNDAANGLAVFYNGTLLGIDIFNRKEVFSEYFMKILKGVAMEARYMRKREEFIDEVIAGNMVIDFLRRCDATTKRVYKGVAEGLERRFEMREYSGFELEYENNMIHMGVNYERV